MLIKAEMIAHKKVTQFLKFPIRSQIRKSNIHLHWMALLYHKQFGP
jgi:hypothetical protein